MATDAAVAGRRRLEAGGTSTRLAEAGPTAFGYAAFVDAALAALGIERAHLDLPDFGGPIGLAWAATHADRPASLTLIDVGILPGYKWHRLARIWRTPVLGELFQATATRGAFLVAALKAADPAALVIWGGGDPYLPSSYAERQREFLPRAPVLMGRKVRHIVVFRPVNVVSATRRRGRGASCARRSLRARRR